jgi:ligand-binding sensor domain-containing protein
MPKSVSLFGNAQEYSWKYYSVSDGLPQTQIYNLYQDSKGYIYIGTKGGLSKFDGIEFKNFTTNDGLSFDFITSVQEDQHDGVYIGTRNGTNYLKDGKIRPLSLNPDPTSIFQFIEKNGIMWFFSGVNGLSCYQSSERLDGHPVFDHISQEDKVIGISFNLFTDEILINKYSNESIHWSAKGAAIIQKNDREIYPKYNEEGLLYGISADSIYGYENGRFFPILSRKNRLIRNVVSWQEIYFSDRASNSKLFLFDGKNIHQFHQPFNMVLDVMKDDEGNLWVGTESGLWRLQSYGFQNYLSERNNNFYTWSVAQDKDGNYLFGSFLHGLMTYDGVSFRKVPIDHMFKDNGYQFFYSGKYVDRYGNVFLGTSRGIIRQYGSDYSWFYRHDPNDAILYIYYDNDEDQLLCTSSRHGLIEVDFDGNVFEHNDRTRRDYTGLETSVLKDKFGRIWLSGKMGICIKEDGKWKKLPDDNDSIPIGAISMLKDYQDNIWLGSNDGLYLYDYNKLERVGANIFNQQIGILDVTDNQELLIGSIKGIGLLNLKAFYEHADDHIRYFDANNGFLGTECKHNSSFKDREGNIWICASDRVVRVNPKALKSNSNAPRVYIESISTLSDNMEWQPTIKVGRGDMQYQFEKNFDDLRFDYHGISHSAPNGVRYQTMLEGYDNYWSSSTKERYRTYTNLPSGDYIFKVKAYNNDGIESDFTGVEFEILPAWYELPTLRIGGLISLLAFAALLGFLYSERLRKRKISAEQNERRIAKLQFKALRGLIDPHFTFNAINSIAAMVYKENRDEAYRYFTKFSKLIRSAFDTSEKTTRTIREELAFVANYMDVEKMRFKDRFGYEIDVHKNINHDWEIPKMVIQIYVENSIKHGLIEKKEGGWVKIKLDLSRQYLRISVRDNGIGRKNSKTNGTNGTLGRGTHIMKEYFKLLNKFNDSKITTKTVDLIDSMGHPNGTEVLIQIPLKYRYNI